MKKDILKEVFTVIKNNHTKANIIAEQNLEIALKNEKFYENYKKIRLLNFELGVKSFNKEPTDDIENEIKNLKQNQREILATLNFSEADLLPKYNCKFCGDTGLNNGELCICVVQEYNKKLMQDSHINLNEVPSLNDYNYKFFTQEKECETAKKCVEIFKDYISNFNNLEKKNIVLCGETGTGKTYLTKVLAKELVKKNISTLFISAFDMNNVFASEHFSQDMLKRNFKNLLNVDVLIIDDIGTEPIKRNITKEYFLILLNERLNLNKATIITTNFSPQKVLEVYDARIFSRMFNKRTTLVINFNGTDNRIYNKKA